MTGPVLINPAESNRHSQTSTDGFVLRCSVGGGGPTVAVKDVIDVEGFATQAGSQAFSDNKSCISNAYIVSSLLDAGCRIVGKTTLHELAYGVTGLNDWAGTPVNPAFPTLIPGGSSSGSAAVVAANLCDFSIGTDTGGSVRVPAACCGVLGLKPTFGRLSRQGITPAVSSLDCPGPFARTGRMLTTAMQAMDPTIQRQALAPDLRIGWIPASADAAVADMALAAARRLGISVTDTDLPLLAEAHQAGLTVIGHETYAAFSPLLASGRVGADVAGRLAKAAFITNEDVAQAETVRSRFTAAVDDALCHVDVLALPTLPYLPPRLSEAADLMKMVTITSLCRPFNLSGHPALALPAGELDGRPVSLQLVARKGADALLLALAERFDAVRPSEMKIHE